MVDNTDTATRIEEVVQKILEPLGFDLVEAKCMRANQTIMIRLLIDRLEGGITLEECTQLNKRIGTAFDENNIIQQHYTLEVSSPGLDRYLITSKDFRRTLNRAILVFLKEEYNGIRQLQGTLRSVDEGGICLVGATGKETRITFTKIHKAKQVIA